MQVSLRIHWRTVQEVWLRAQWGVVRAFTVCTREWVIIRQSWLASALRAITLISHLCKRAGSHEWILIRRCSTWWYLSGRKYRGTKTLQRQSNKYTKHQLKLSILLLAHSVLFPGIFLIHFANTWYQWVWADGFIARNNSCVKESVVSLSCE